MEQASLHAPWVYHLAGHWEPLYYQKRVMLAYKEQKQT